jgi:capsular polysaccharide biosynthesis protein
MVEIINVNQSDNLTVPIVRKSSYRSTSPNMLNVELVPERWRVPWLKITGRRRAEIPAAHVCLAKNAIVFSQGAVLTSDNKFIEETLPPTPIAPPAGPVKYVPGHVALLRKPGDNNYGHWLVEMLPRVREFRAVLGKHIRFAIPANPFAMKDTRRETLAWLNVAEPDIIWLNNEPTRFDEVSFITSNSIHSHTHDCFGIRNVVKKAVHGKDCGSGRKLYVARDESIRRAITNGVEVRNLFENNGFDTVFPEKINLSEQVKLFRSADVVAGVSGAALTNLMWMRPGTKVLSLNPNLGYEFFFWDLANIMDVGFSIIFGQATDETKGVHSDFTVDLSLINEWITGLE